MKKIIPMLACTALLFNCTAFAENQVTLKPIDQKTNTVTIEGVTDSKAAGKRVVLIVTNPNTELGGINTYKDILQQEDIVFTEKDGAFKFSFELNTDTAKTGYYNVYMSGDDFQKRYTTSFYFASEADRIKGIDDINTLNASELDIDNIILMYGLDNFLPAKEADSDWIAKKLKENGRISNTDFEKVQAIVKEAAVVDMFNRGLTDKVSDEELNLLYNDTVGYSESDINGVTVYKAYTDILNKKGKEKVLSAVSNKALANLKDLKESLYKNIFLYAFNNTDRLGTSHVEELLTRENCARLGISINKYFASDRKGSIHSDLISMTECSSISELQSRIETLADKYAKTQTSPGGSGSGNGGKGTVNFNSGNNVSETNNEIEKALYNDVQNGMWAKEAIEFLSKRGILSGFPNGEFKPNEQISREQFAKIVCMSAGIDTDDNYNIKFDDVDYSSWYAPYVNALYKKGIIAGKNENTFGVGEAITRQDVCVILYRLKSREQEELNMEYTDKDDISPYAETAVGYFSARAVINGFDDGTFLPKKSCTRAEASRIIFNYINEDV